MTCRPAVAPSTAWRFPTFTETLLNNGLRLWLCDLPGQHVLSCQVVFDAPVTAEPSHVEGVAQLAVQASDEGTLAHSADDVALLLENHGAVYDGQAGRDATFCGIDVPTTRLAPALAILAEIVATPAYDDETVARHVAFRLADIEQAEAQPGWVAKRRLREELFIGRDARPAGGTTETVTAITADDVRSFHDSYWSMGSATLVIAGHLPDDIITIVDDAFGSLPAGRPAPRHEAPVIAQDANRVIVVERPGSVQAEVRIGRPTVTRTHPQWPALRVAMAAMGGAFGSRTNLELRERLGYTYGTSMGASPQRDCGVITFSASVRNEVAGDAVQAALRLLRQADFTDTEIASAKAYLADGAGLRYDTPAVIADQAAALASAGLTPEYMNDHLDRLRSTSTQEACDAYQDLVATQPLTVVAVGDPTLVEQLSTTGSIN